MIVKLRLEISDEQRRAITGKKKLASRQEVTEFVEGCIAALEIVYMVDAVTPQIKETAHRPTIDDLMTRVLLEDAKSLKGKTDNFVRGWAKVKYGTLLRST